MADYDDSSLKAAFAAFFIESKADSPQQKAYEAAKRLYPREKDQGEVNRICWLWPTDQTVILEIQRLQKEAPKAEGLPSKEDIIRTMWKLAESDMTPHKDRVAMARLIADMCGHIKNPGDDAEGKRMPSAPVYKIVDA